MLVKGHILREKVDAAFIRDDEHTIIIGKLQEIICNFDKVNISSSVEKITGIGFTTDSFVSDLVRSIIKLSNRRILLSKFCDKSDFISQIEHPVNFEIDVGAQPFLLSISNYLQINLLLKKEEGKLHQSNEYNCIHIRQVIEDDNIKEIEEIFPSPVFNINKRYNFYLPKLISLLGNDLTLTEYAAFVVQSHVFDFSTSMEQRWTERLILQRFASSTWQL